MLNSYIKAARMPRANCGYVKSSISFNAMLGKPATAFLVLLFFCIPAVQAQSPASGKTVMDAHDITFRYSDRGEPVLRGVSLRVNRGDWLLLEGASGGGKSTLAAPP